MTLSPAVWQRVRDGLAPDAGLVADVAKEETGPLGAERVAESREALAARVLGAGPLEVWLDDPAVTDLAVNGDGKVWLDRGGGMEWTQRFPYQPRGMVQNTFGPLDRLPGLQVGQRWESQVISPLTGKMESGIVEVVDKQVIAWGKDNNPVSTLVVVSRMGTHSARTWVRPADGLVLQQEIPFPMRKLVLVRQPDDDPAPDTIPGRGRDLP